MKEVLDYISAELERVGVPYEFLEWTQAVTYPYFVGEYNEFEPTLESGECDKSFILTGFCRGKDARLKLEEMKDKVERAFPERDGNVATLNSGSVVAIFYGSAFYVSTGEAQLYKIQINLSIKLWKVVQNG